MGRRRSDDDDLIPDLPPADDVTTQIEWSTCKSSRRLLITLNEAGAPLEPLAERVRKVARQLAETGRLDARWDLTDNPYEKIVSFAVRELGPDGEEIVCKTIRASYPEPPRPISGVLYGTGKLANLSPRVMANKLRRPER